MAALFYLQGKCIFQPHYMRQKVIKFVVYSVCDCFTHSFVSFFVVAGMNKIWLISFIFAKIKIIGYVGFLSTQVACIQVCLQVPVCFAILTVCCMPGFTCKASCQLTFCLLSPISHITLIMPSNSVCGILSNAGPFPHTTNNPH